MYVIDDVKVGDEVMAWCSKIGQYFIKAGEQSKFIFIFINFTGFKFKGTRGLQRVYGTCEVNLC